MKPNWPLVIAGYALGLLCMLPIVETILSVWPLDLSNVDWRFGALGRLGQNSITPLLGLGVVVTLAGWQNHGRMMVAISLIATVAALVAAGAAVVFTFDMMAVRPRVADDLARTFQTTAVMALFRLTLTSCVAGLISWGAWITLHRHRRDVRTAHPGVVASAKR